MRARPLPAVALAAVLLAAGLPASAGTADLTGTLTISIGVGTGIPVSATPLSGSATGVSFASSGGAFSVPAGIFTTHVSSPVGFTASADPGSIYTIRTITNTSNLTGTFAGSGGAFSGVMGTGSSVTVELGVVPLPNVFGFLHIPVNVGSPDSGSAMGSVLGNAVTIAVLGTSWTTGQVTYSDQTFSAPTASYASFGTVSGSNNLTASGGSIRLVTPFLILIRGAAIENRAGYAQLTLSFTNKVPEPAAVVLLATAAAALWIRAPSAGTQRATIRRGRGEDSA